MLNELGKYYRIIRIFQKKMLQILFAQRLAKFLNRFYWTLVFSKEMKLAEAVRQSGTDTTNLIFDDNMHTTLAFVHTFPDGEHEFNFYRNPGADMMLKKEEVRRIESNAGKI